MRPRLLRLLKLLPALLLALSWAITVRAQTGYTSVTAVVQDSFGTVYQNAPYTVTFFDPGISGKLPTLTNGSTFQQFYAGYATDSSGNLSIMLPDNNTIAAASGATGTQWRFSICSNIQVSNPPQCFSVLLTITGTSQNITSALSAAAALLPPTAQSQALKPKPSDAIQFVSASGNDLNDGRSMGSAKLTWQAGATAACVGQTGHVYIAAGVYPATSDVNLTGLTSGCVIEGVASFATTPGATLYNGTVLQVSFTGANTVGVDISSVNSLTLRNLVISCGTSTANSPTICLLHGRSSGSNGIQDTFDHLFVVGYSPWIYYNYHGEQLSAIDCLFGEYATTGTPITLSEVNTAGITSPNVTFGGVNSETVFAFEGGTTSVTSQATAAGSKLLYLDEGSASIQSVRFRGFANLSAANEVFVGDTSGATGAIQDVTIEVTAQDSTPGSNSMTSIAGTADSWHITGLQTSGATTTPFVFSTLVRHSFIDFSVGVVTGSCFTASGDAIASTIILDFACGGHVTAPGAFISTSSVQSPVVAEVNLTTQAANIGATTLYIVPASGAGMYRVCSYEIVTQQATTSSTLPQVNVLWTDLDTNTVPSAGLGAIIEQSGIGGSNPAVGTVASYVNGLAANVACLAIDARASTNIQYSTTLYASSGATPMLYALHMRLEFLGP